MTGKITTLMLCIMLIFSLCVFAANGDTATSEQSQEAPMSSRGQMPDGGGVPEGMRGQRPYDNMKMPSDGMPSRMPQGEMPQMPSDGNFAPPMGGMGNEIPSDGGRGMGRGPGGFSGGMPQWNTEENTVASKESNGGVWDFLKEYQTPVISVILLAAAFVFVVFYKKKTF